MEGWYDNSCDAEAAAELDALRHVVGDQFREASPEELRGTVAQSLAGLSPGEAEGVLSGLRQLGTQLLRGATTGASWGGSLGGPLGGVIGGLGAAGLSFVQRSAERREEPEQGESSRAAAQLLQALQSPQVLQALLSVAMGKAGRPSIAMGDTAAPVGAFVNMLGALAGRAAVDAERALTEVGDSYLRDSAGEYACDIVDGEARADRLLELLECEPMPCAPQGRRPDPAVGAVEWLADNGVLIDTAEELI